MKLLVCGSRDYTDYESLKILLAGFLRLNPHHPYAIFGQHTIIAGGARGVDLLAARFAEEHRLELEEILPDWDKHGKAAGFIRNQEMINLNPLVVMAFWNGESRGTKDTLTRARKNKIMTYIIYH